jgi:hypothetical protein
MRVPTNKSPNNTSKWQVGFNLAFKGLNQDGTTLPMFSVITTKNSDIVVE